MNELVSQLAQLCIHSYPEIREEENEWRNRLTIQIPGVKFHQESGQTAFSFIDENRLFIIFRGTKFSFNWFRNFMIGKKDLGSKAKCHQGFYEAASVLWSQGLLGQEISRAMGNDMRICLAGHSQGAAMATVVAWYAEFSGMPIELLLAMNSPRVGNWRFIYELDKQMGARWVRTQHSRDVVPDLPTKYLGYMHGGKHVFFDRRAECSINPGWAFVAWDRWEERLHDWKKGKFFKQIINDHDVRYNAELIHIHRHKICPQRVVDMDIQHAGSQQKEG